jgi:hypothetical protein
LPRAAPVAFSNDRDALVQKLIAGVDRGVDVGLDGFGGLSAIRAGDVAENHAALQGSVLSERMTSIMIATRET